MQYGQRKLQRSVTEMRKSRRGRRNWSAKGPAEELCASAIKVRKPIEVAPGVNLGSHPAKGRPVLRAGQPAFFGFNWQVGLLSKQPFPQQRAALIAPVDGDPAMSEPTSPSKPAAKADDRNVVPVQGGPEATLEDRLFLFWKNYRTTIYGAIVIVLAAIIGREAWQFYAANREATIRTAYGAADTADAKRAFARENAGHPLAGIALLAAADDAYSNADYARAGREYGEARAALKDASLAARAQLGEALCTIQGGLASKGEPMLRAFAADKNMPATLRIEAWYQLAVLALADGNHAPAREALEKLGELPLTRDWSFRIADLRSRLPAVAQTEPTIGTPSSLTPPAPAPQP
jgi:hypothetical protein